MGQVEIGQFTILHTKVQGDPDAQLQVIEPSKPPSPELWRLLHDFLNDAITGSLLEGVNLAATTGKNARLVADEMFRVFRDRLLGDGINSEAMAQYVLLGLLHTLGDRRVLTDLVGIPLRIFVEYEKLPMPEVKIPGLRRGQTAEELLVKSGLCASEKQAKIALLRRWAHLNGIRLTLDPGKLKVPARSILQCQGKTVRLRDGGKG